MKIATSKLFNKQYAKLGFGDQQRFKTRIAIFRVNPYDQRLRNHALKGKYSGYRSIDIRSDLRALYTMEGNTVIIFGFIGTHSQLY